MTGDPPFDEPAVQLNPIFSASVISGKLIKSTGASGTYYITAPDPSIDISDSP